MNPVLITGAGGFIGSRVAAVAEGAGYSVIRLFHRQPFREAAHAFELDLRLPLDHVPAVDSIFHLAGGYAGAGRKALEAADLTIARNLIRWGTENHVKNWIFASAAEVYGSIHGLATEQSPTNPVIPYGHIKLAIETLLAQMAQRLPNVRVVILRIGEVYGSGSRLFGELAVRLKQGFCPLPGSGHVPVSFVHVEDVVSAFLSSAESARPGVSVYNVADDEPATWRAFVCHFAGLLRTRGPLFLPRPLLYGYALGHRLRSSLFKRDPIVTRHALRLLTTPKVLSNQKIKQELGFRPRFSNFRLGLEASLNGLSHHS